jgi:tripartite-type tricarboxylate transporter receptor subunit TctC
MGPKMSRRSALALGLGLALPGAALAQGFPERQVTMVVPFAAGGSTDVVARIVAQAMGEELGQQVIVENVTGGGGSIGADQVVRAEADGYTILMGTVATHALNPLVLPDVAYDPQADFAPISLLVLVPNVLVVNPELGVESVAELVELLKAEPEAHFYASSGNGTPLHLSGELFNSLAGVEMEHVPYQGSGPALEDLLGNQVSIMFDNLPSSAPYIQAGTLRALGVTTLERAASFPDLPTIAETVPGYETYTWNALFAPAGTPAEAIERLNAAAVAAMADPEVVARLEEFSATVVASTPEELTAHVAAEVERWTPIVEEAGLRPE